MTAPVTWTSLEPVLSGFIQCNGRGLSSSDVNKQSLPNFCVYNIIGKQTSADVHSTITHVLYRVFAIVSYSESSNIPPNPIVVNGYRTPLKVRCINQCLNSRI